jgi:hypothetical protein
MAQKPPFTISTSDSDRDIYLPIDMVLNILQFLNSIEMAEVIMLFKRDFKMVHRITQSVSIPLSFLRSSLVGENLWFPNIMVDVDNFSDHDITLIGNICTRLHMNPPDLYNKFPPSIKNLSNLTTLDLGKNIKMDDHLSLFTPFIYMPKIQSIIVPFSITLLGITMMRDISPSLVDKFIFPRVSCVEPLSPEMVEIIYPSCKQLRLSCANDCLKSGKRIDSLPDNFHLFEKNLHTLDLGNCWLDKIPDEIFNLSNLRYLELGRWYNHKIDERWLRLTNLEQFLIGSYYQHALPIHILIQMPRLKVIQMNSKYLYKHRDHMLALQYKMSHISFQDFRGKKLNVDCMFPIDTILPWFYCENENGMEEYPSELDMNLNHIEALIPDAIQLKKVSSVERYNSETIIPRTILHPDEMEALQCVVVERNELNPVHQNHLIASLQRIGWHETIPTK